MPKPFSPTKEEVLAAVGHHFARPGNRFWPALHLSGFTERCLSPFEERELLARGLGITNVGARATAATELIPEESKRGCRLLRAVTSHNVCLIATHNHFLMWHKKPMAPTALALTQCAPTILDTWTD